MNSASTAPIRGIARPIGSDLKRSKTPLSMSPCRFWPMAMLLIAIVWPSIPGSRNSR